jgi:hypothetical protein
MACSRPLLGKRVDAPMTTRDDAKAATLGNVLYLRRTGPLFRSLRGPLGFASCLLAIFPSGCGG